MEDLDSTAGRQLSLKMHGLVQEASNSVSVKQKVPDICKVDSPIILRFLGSLCSGEMELMHTVSVMLRHRTAVKHLPAQSFTWV